MEFIIGLIFAAFGIFLCFLGVRSLKKRKGEEGVGAGGFFLAWFLFGVGGLFAVSGLVFLVLVL